MLFLHRVIYVKHLPLSILHPPYCTCVNTHPIAKFDALQSTVAFASRLKWSNTEAVTKACFNVVNAHAHCSDQRHIVSFVLITDIEA